MDRIRSAEDAVSISDSLACLPCRSGFEVTVVDNGLEAGADDCVAKPFSSAELIARMRAVLRRHRSPEPSPPTVLGSGRVQMDVDQHQVTVDGVPVSLPLRSSLLFEALVRVPGQVLSRGQLIDQVWGPDSGVENRALDAQVTRLRHVLESDPLAPRHLGTVRSLGYFYDS